MYEAVGLVSNTTKIIMIFNIITVVPPIDLYNCMINCLGRIRKCGLVGVSVSLGLDFVVLKVHTIPYR